MNKLLRHIVFIFTVVIIFLASNAQAGFLSTNVTQEITNNADVVQEKAGYDPNVTVGSVVGAVIKGFLALLGVIFVVLIVIAGFNWMTAGGDEEKINKAKSTLSAAVIGLLIVISAYAITYFVFKYLPGGSSQYGGS